MHKMKLFSLALVAMLCVVFSSCYGSKSEADIPTVPDSPTDVTIGEYVWTLNGGASFDSDVLHCPAGATAICSDANLPNSYILECDITATNESGSGIAINDISKEFHYILEINAKDDKLILKKFVSNKTIPVADAVFYCDAGSVYHLKLAVFAGSVKVFLNDENGQASPYPLIDLLIDKYRPNFISVVSEDNQFTAENISIRQNDMVLDGTESYKNPVAVGADPHILFHDGVYYLYSTNAVNSGYKVFTSTNLKTWEDKGYCLRTADVYGSPTKNAGFWAPEVYNYNGKFYLIYTVDEHLGIAVADSPLGPFTSPKQSYISEHREIDGHLFFDDDGKVYLFFVRCGSSAGTGIGNEIFGAEFDMETLTYKNEKCILYPQADTWEWIGDTGYVAEGPSVLKHEGKYYLTYSANGYTSKDYAIGVAISSSPLGNYEKYEGNPILKKSEANGVYGPGHHSFTYSPDGTELLIVYHRHNSKQEVSSRTTCIDRAYFEYDDRLGYDVLRIAGPTSAAQPLPSGLE